MLPGAAHCAALATQPLESLFGGHLQLEQAEVRGVPKNFPQLNIYSLEIKSCKTKNRSSNQNKIISVFAS